MWRQAVRNSRPCFASLRFRAFYSSQPQSGRLSMKDLAKKYGWTATGVYFALMGIDLPLSYALVHSLGQDTMTDYEVAIRRWIGADTKRDETYVSKAASTGKGLFFTELGIAYIIHKILIVVRLPLTVALTPRVAAKLQQWGFKVTQAVPTLDKAKLAKKVSQTTGDKSMVPKSASTSAKQARSSDKPGGSSGPHNEGTKTEVSEKFGSPVTKKNRWFQV